LKSVGIPIRSAQISGIPLGMFYNTFFRRNGGMVIKLLLRKKYQLPVKKYFNIILDSLLFMGLLHSCFNASLMMQQ